MSSRHACAEMCVKSCRIQYAKLWRALILADVDGIKSAAVAMNAGESYQLFAGMLTNRPWDKVRSFRLQLTVLARHSSAANQRRSTCRLALHSSSRPSQPPFLQLPHPVAFTSPAIWACASDSI